jgi:hypothetical protein
MTTRSIVTSQPDVACDVCERRLLRGERADVFLASGERRSVCELCAPRATHEGWLRESDHNAVSLPPARTRRGRSLFDRLRQVARAADDPAQVAGADPGDGKQAERFDFLGGFARADASPAPPRQHGATGESSPITGAEPLQGASAFRSTAGRAARAVELFNAGEHPRRISGLARSLGAPGVSVRPDEDVKHLVSVVVAWELCWYRYGVDVDDEDAPIRVLAQGTELDELPHEDRHANAVADELGALSLSGAEAPFGA